MAKLDKRQPCKKPQQNYSSSDSDSELDLGSPFPSPFMSAKGGQTTLQETTTYSVTINQCEGNVVCPKHNSGPTNLYFNGTVIFGSTASNEDILKHLSQELKIPVENFREAMRTMKTENLTSAPAIDSVVSATTVITEGSSEMCAKTSVNSPQCSSVPTIVDVQHIINTRGSLQVNVKIKRTITHNVAKVADHKMGKICNLAVLLTLLLPFIWIYVA